jgi:molybdopterin-guanine dinucleotide biosynthesis protein A
MTRAVPDADRMSDRRATVAAAIIAGGRGTRMGGAGVSKGLLAVQGRPIVQRQLDVLRRCFDDVTIVANDPALASLLGPDAAGVRVVADRLPGGGIGPLAGLDAALDALPPGAEAVVCVAGDMPFLDAPVLALLRDTAPGATAVLPRIGSAGGTTGHAEPLLARYGRACAPIVREQIQRGDYAMWRLLARLPLVTFIDEPALRAVDPDLRCLFNVNTPGDLAAADAAAPGPGTGPLADRGQRR